MRKKTVAWFFATLLMVFSLSSGSEAKADDPGASILDRGLKYLIQIQNSDGSWPLVAREGGGDLEATLWATRSLFMCRDMGDPEYVVGLEGLAYVVARQKMNGSFSDNAAHTAFALMMLQESGQGKEAMDRAVSWLKKVQNGDGGWRSGLSGPSLSIYTAVVLVAFNMVGIPATDGAVQKGISWLKTAQNPDGGWGMPKGGPSLCLGSSWALTALGAYGFTPDSKPVEKGLSWLLEMQTERNGGFVLFHHPALTADPELTAYALITLSRFKGQDRAIQRAVAYLADVQKPDGVFVSNLPKEFKKKRKPNTQSTCFVIWALKALGR